MGSGEMLTLLGQGATAWNAWRAENPGVRLDFRGCALGALDLVGAQLTGADFSGADLRGAFLADADLSGAVFQGAQLDRVRFDGATCEGSDFRKARLVHAGFTGGRCRGADFRMAGFAREVHFGICDLRSCRFEDTNLEDCWLEGADLRGARLDGAKLRNAHLNEADLREARLEGAELAGAELIGATLSGCNLSKLIMPRCKFTRAALAGTHLQEADLRSADFGSAGMQGAFLGGAWLEDANFIDADLQGAHFDGARLRRARFEGNRQLAGANFRRADLSDAHFDGADLSHTNLENALLLRTRLGGARLVSARVYGISAWDLVLDDATESRDLIITPQDQPTVEVDHIDVAQFTYLLLNNPNIRRVIDTIGKRGVLLLGRFTPERKRVLDALREQLRLEGYVPMLFDFDPSRHRSVQETVVTLAGLSRFVVADLTAPSSLPLELQTVIPVFQIPVACILLEGEQSFSMFKDLYNRHGQEYGGHLLPVLSYRSIEALRGALREKIIEPADRLADQLMARKARPLRIDPLDSGPR